MSKTVHIFFNGRGVVFPERNDWEKFVNEDSARVFVTCAETWRRQGWEVRRLSTIEGEYPVTPFSGRCLASFAWYPAEFWQFVAKAKTIAAAAPEELHWFTTFDVFNFGFTALQAAAVNVVHQDGVRCSGWQRGHFSMALLCCDLAWLEHAERVLMAYDRGELAELRRAYVSDETILREYARHSNAGQMVFACDPDAAERSLVHYSRSALARVFEAVPSSAAAVTVETEKN